MQKHRTCTNIISMPSENEGLGLTSIRASQWLQAVLVFRVCCAEVECSVLFTESTSEERFHICQATWRKTLVLRLHLCASCALDIHRLFVLGDPCPSGNLFIFLTLGTYVKFRNNNNNNFLKWFSYLFNFWIYIAQLYIIYIYIYFESLYGLSTIFKIADK